MRVEGEEERIKRSIVLLANLKANLDELSKLLEEVSVGHWTYEDGIYRFWHQSFKVFSLQATTERICAALEHLAPPGCKINPWFRQIVAEGTGKTFDWWKDNDRWLEVTRPILEAFFHARFMLEMAVHYGRELDTSPNALPSGWAALLYLYGLR